MTSSQPTAFERLTQLFEQLRGCTPERRTGILAAQAPGLRSELEELLRYHDAPRSALDAELDVLERPLGELLTEPLDGAASPLPARIGRFAIVGRLGSGGMGEVYLAEERELDRRLALKVLRPGLHTRDQLRRFRRAAQVLARLRHPGIAQIYAAGMHGDGAAAQPYIAMELVDGQSLLAFADAAELDRTARLELLVRLCDAVHHAHEQGSSTVI